MTDYPGKKIAIAIEHVAEALDAIAAAINLRTYKEFPSFFDDLIEKEKEKEDDNDHD